MAVFSLSVVLLALSAGRAVVAAPPTDHDALSVVRPRPRPRRLATLAERASQAYVAPNSQGGSELDNATAVVNGLGEPLNVIISGLSSPEVLSDSGFLEFAQSIGFSEECLDQHLGTKQQANLGDGRGWTDEVRVYRQDYGDPLLGTCLESLDGGNHFRLWRQNGTEAPTGALFLAVSREENLSQGHTIVPNGYNIGRDQLVSNATAAPTSWLIYKYTTTVEWVTGLLEPGSAGVNHGIAQDGRVAVLTVTRSSKGGLGGLLSGLGL